MLVEGFVSDAEKIILAQLRIPKALAGSAPAYKICG